VSDERFDFDEVFDEDYLYFYEPILAQTSDADSEVIWQLLGLDAGAQALDLACGYGRIAERLAQRGASVAGLDSSPLFLEHARQSAAAAGLEIEYVQGDMRALPWPAERFDAVVSWFTSFGYFSDEENRQVLRDACRVLEHGGRLLIELNNLPQLLARWLPTVVLERDGDFVIDRHRFDPVTGRAVTERLVVRNSRTRRFNFSVRMFVAAELRDWLLDAGFSAVAFYDHQADPLTAAGRRAIAVARK
jgi:ubiquinone/menaquinone biosynthesis C-methylase UbiE